MHTNFICIYGTTVPIDDNWTVRNWCFEKNNYLTHGKSVEISQEAYYVPL